MAKFRPESRRGSVRPGKGASAGQSWLSSLRLPRPQRLRHATRGTDGEESGRRFGLENAEGLLEPGNLILAALLPLLVGHRLHSAARLHLGEVLEHRVQLGLLAGTVFLEVRDALLEAGLLLELVLDVLLLHGLL